MRITGLDKFQKKLDRLAKNAKRIDGENKVSFAELFTEAFMRKHTNFSSIKALFESGGFVVNSPEDFKAIPDEALDVHVKATTRFSSWEEMLKVASREWAQRELFR